jgi:hypothetical protein
MALIAERLKIPGVNLRGVSWGAEHGANTDRVAEALPPATKGLEEQATGPEVDAAEWAQLLEDPLFEIRLAAVRGETTSAGPTLPLPAQTTPGQDAIAMLHGAPSRLLPIPDTEMLTSDVKTAAERIASNAQLLEDAAAGFGKATDPEFVTVLARAVAAECLGAHRSDPPSTAPASLYDRGRREQLVDAIAKGLLPAGTKGLGGWLITAARSIAAARATSAIQARRNVLTAMTLPAIADILLYQRRGTDILEIIKAEIDHAERPIVALGHSLGGIMLVDLLSTVKPPTVDLLITIGSQAPLFFLVDALGTLRPSAKQAPFTPWLNIYDRNDFLSYCAQRVFAGTQRIWDREVISGVPFPESHSAYFLQDRTYELIRDFWPTAQVGGGP